MTPVRKFRWPEAPDVLLILGATLIVAGVWLWSSAVALILAGGLCAWTAFALAANERSREQDHLHAPHGATTRGLDVSIP